MRTPSIIAFAKTIGRTPSAVAMKLVNFASLDPAQKKRNIKGLGNVSSFNSAIWEEFEAAPNSVAEQSEEEFNRLSLPAESPLETEPQLPQGGLPKSN